jgi:hypothetical protein
MDISALIPEVRTYFARVYNGHGAAAPLFTDEEIKAALAGAVKFDEEYHGPTPPGDGWVHSSTGPRGGKIWTRAPKDDKPPEPDATPPEAQTDTSGTAEAYALFSPNQEENLSFEEAAHRLGSESQQQLKVIAADVVKQAGLKGERPVNAIGDWSDGAENSIIEPIRGEVNPDALKYAAAYIGAIANQKAVLTFTTGDGPDSVFRMHVNGTSGGKLRESLDKHGIEFRTLVPTHTGYDVVVVDLGRQLTNNIEGFADEHGIQVKEGRGTAEFIGGESRDGAAKEYDRIIREYEAKPDRARYRLPQGANSWRRIPAEEKLTEDFAASDWTQITGPRGGHIWRNNKSGRIVYAMTNPGHDADKVGDQEQHHRTVIRDVHDADNLASIPKVDVQRVLGRLDNMPPQHLADVAADLGIEKTDDAEKLRAEIMNKVIEKRHLAQPDTPTGTQNTRPLPGGFKLVADFENAIEAFQGAGTLSADKRWDELLEAGNRVAKADLDESHRNAINAVLQNWNAPVSIDWGQKRALIKGGEDIAPGLRVQAWLPGKWVVVWGPHGKSKALDAPFASLDHALDYAKKVGPLLDWNQPGVDGLKQAWEKRADGKPFSELGKRLRYIADHVRKTAKQKPERPATDTELYKAEDIAPGVPTPEVMKKIVEAKATIAKKLATGKVLAAKANGQHGRNSSFVLRMDGPDGKPIEALFKPRAGERGDMKPHITDNLAGREVAASEMADALGMNDMVSPVVMRKFGDDEVPGGWLKGEGSLQYWAEGVHPAWNSDKPRWDGDEDCQRAAAFDWVLFNNDRHTGNWLVDDHTGKLTLIDHGFSMPTKAVDEEFDDRGFTHHAADEFGEIPESLKSWADKEPEIRKILKRNKLEPKAIEGVIERLKFLKVAKHWYELNADRLRILMHPGEVELEMPAGVSPGQHAHRNDVASNS